MEVERAGRGSADSHVIAYRPDVDGLRAVAVLSVILYHLSDHLLPGGYLGVDVFFVISGYLITSIIWREVQQKKFTIARFYDRRIRRILPALLVMLFTVTIASLFFLLPSNLIGYGKSLLATLVFMSNIFFWRDGDYFGGLAEQKPLLHLWSIGVEEQFYIFFPIILILIVRFWPKGVLPTVILLTIGSFALNVGAFFVDGATPAFFLLPTRAWELGFGAILAVIPPHVGPRGRMANLFAIIGAILVIVSVINPQKFVWFLPVSLPAVVGATLVVIAGKAESTLVTKALRWSPVVFIGLISYSLYLWHWPIIVFSRYVLVRDLTNMEMAFAFLIMIGCATASWWFIERPFRSKSMPGLTVRAVSGIGMLGMALAGVALVWTNGFPGRLSPEAAQINAAIETHFRCPVADYVSVGLSRGCRMGVASGNPQAAEVVLMGNSHALMYTPVWSSILTEQGKSGVLININRCLPITTVNLDKKCMEFAERNVANVAGLKQASTVIIGFNWNFDDLVDRNDQPVDNSNNKALIAGLDDLIAQFQRMGKRVILIGPIATPGYDFASTVSRQIAFGHPVDRPTSEPTASFMQTFAAAIQHFEQRSDITFVRADQVLCDAERCHFMMDGRSLFSDSSHISMHELYRFQPLFTAALQTSLAGQRDTLAPNAAAPTPAMPSKADLGAAAQ